MIDHRLDPAGYARACRHDKWMIDLWLQRHGFETRDVVTIESYTTSSVVLVERNLRNAEGKFYFDHEKKDVAREFVAVFPSCPVPWPGEYDADLA